MILIKDTNEHKVKGIAIDVIEDAKFEIFDTKDITTYLGSEELAGSDPNNVVTFPAGYQIPFSFDRIKLHQGFILVR